MLLPSPARLVALFAGYGDERAFAEGARRSPEWPKYRRGWLADYAVCENCGGTDYLEVHHKVLFSWEKKLELVRSNFITLCEDPARNCHLNTGHGGNWKKGNPHVVADAARNRVMYRDCLTRESYVPGTRW